MSGDLHTLRMILVGTAVIAAITAAILGYWLAAAVLTVGVFVHGFATVYLRKVAGERDAGAEAEADQA